MSLEHKCHASFLEIIIIKTIREHKCHGYFLEIIIIKTSREHTLMRLINSSATYLFLLDHGVSVPVYQYRCTLRTPQTIIYFLIV